MHRTDRRRSAVSTFMIVLAIALLPTGSLPGGELTATLSDDGNSITVQRDGNTEPILTQVAKEDFRPYLHPIVAPDGKGQMTQFSPGHHPHQTGLYWGFTRVNGRDYFHHPGGDYWKRVSVSVLSGAAKSGNESVQWQTVYDLLGEDGKPVLRQSQIWSVRDGEDGYAMQLQWTADANVDVTLGQYDYGGLFLRMPWSKDSHGHAINSARQSDRRCEGQRAVWTDVGIQVPGRSDMAHVAIFDHPSNRNFPNAWRVDGQLGIGPAITRLGDWKIAAGKSAGLKFGFLMYAGDRTDAQITKHWCDFSGEPMPRAQWKLARQEGRDAKFLTPEAAAAEMTVTDGFAVNVYAAEPMITQPMAFCWDDRGRMWVAENRDYENRRTGFSGSGDSRIVILDDSDHDGVADSRKVFAEGIPFPAAMAIGMGGLWLGAPPNLLFIPDRDGDDKADMDDVEVRLTGWGIRDRHETLNSFQWGPDGWLYGLQGFATPSTVGRPAGGGKLYKHGEPYPEDIAFDGETTKINGGVWRYHPTKDRFEVVAHGFSNPWGIDHDKHGQLFITACVIPHLWHVIPGGTYHRQGGTHFNPHVYDDIKTIADHRHRSAHGGARVYQSDAYPPRYQDRIFMANIHEHAVLTDILKPKGSGFVGVHGDDFLLANNAQWVGFSVEIGPQGDVYVLDWHDADICGAAVINKETGRIFRISPRESLAEDFPDRSADLSTLSNVRLAELQRSPSAWHARRAQTLLQHRATERDIDSRAIEILRSIFTAESETPLRLRAMWTLHVIGKLKPATLTEALADRAEYVRGWAVQLLCEDKDPPTVAVTKFQQMAVTEESPIVRLFLASAAQRLNEDAKWPLLRGLVGHASDADDHNLPKMVWFASEPLVTADPQQALRLAATSQLPLVTRNITRRLGDADQVGLVAAAITDAAGEQSKFEATDDFIATAMLLGLRDSLEGRYDVDIPRGWSETVSAVAGLDPRSIEITNQLSQQLGDRKAAEAMLAVARNRQADPEMRRRAIEGLAGQRHPALPNILLGLMKEETLRTTAIRAAASFDEPKLTQTLLSSFDSLDAGDQLETLLSLSSRSGSGLALTGAIRDGKIARGDVPAYVARSLQRVVGNGFIEVWGPIESLGADKEAVFTKYRNLLKPSQIAAANADHGKAVFQKTCQACHQLHGEGGKVGPDITGANRSNLEYLLTNILTPSAEIQDAYRMQMILTDEGRVYSGIPAEENERQLKLRVANQTEPIAIAKATIESREVAKVSMMPTGILDQMTDDEVRDLFAYLQSGAQAVRAQP